MADSNEMTGGEAIARLLRAQAAWLLFLLMFFMVTRWPDLQQSA